MDKRFIDAGKIVNTHGVRGEVRIVPWCDSAEFLSGFQTLYIDGRPVRLLSGRVHKGNLLATLEGVEDVNGAMRLKNRVVQISRDDASLPEGSNFVIDLIGLEARNAANGAKIGRVTDVLNLPANDVYVVTGEREYLIPAVSEFIAETNVEGGYIAVHMQKGLAKDED